jgi:hypothetical protein
VAIPRAVLMLIGGAMTDHISPRKILMSAASARAIFVAVIGALLWLRMLHIWELYVLGLRFWRGRRIFPARRINLPAISREA